MDKTLYRGWWHALSLSNRDNWTPEVEEAFGPTADLLWLKWWEPFEAGGNVLWDQWWEACEDLFKPNLERYVLDELETKEDFAWWHDRWREPELQDSFVVMVSLQNSKRAILEEFEKLLRQKHQGKRGSSERDDEWFDWPLQYTPNVTAIETALNVYTLRERSRMEGRRLTAVQIASEVGIESPKSAAPENALGVRVNRYYKHAKQLIEGVERGIYPTKLE